MQACHTHKLSRALSSLPGAGNIPVAHLTRGKVSAIFCLQYLSWLVFNIQSIYLCQDYELIRNDGNMLSYQGEGGVPMKMLRGIV